MPSTERAILTIPRPERAAHCPGQTLTWLARVRQSLVRKPHETRGFVGLHSCFTVTPGVRNQPEFGGLAAVMVDSLEG